MYHTKRSRRGFTLIELLVVLSIIAILAALSAAAIQRVRINQMVRNTESTVAKLQSGVDDQVKAIMAGAKKERQNSSLDFNKLLPFCDNDLDRTEAMLAYIRLRQNLPFSIGDANSPSLTIAPPAPAPPIFIAQQPTPFKALTNAPGIAGSNDPDRISAAFLYIALSQQTLQGSTFASDEATTGAQLDITLNGVNCRTFTDAWKNPIGYRLVSSVQLPELATAPYAKTGGEFDPFDPLGKLSNWTNANKAAFQNYLGVTFDGKNKRMIVYAAGINRNYDNLGLDDILGHRLVSIGQRGAK